MKQRSWMVIGAGPVGSIAACHLAGAGQRVAVLDLQESLIDPIRTKGITVTNLSCGDGGDPGSPRLSQDSLRAHPEGAATSLEELSAFEPDTAVIATKTSALPAVISALGSLDEKLRSIVVLQNGIDNEDSVARAFGKERTFRVVVNYAGGRVAPGTIKMTFFHRPNFIGALDPARHEEARQIARAFTDAALETVYSETIKVHEWAKTILNAGLSPVCAVSRLKMSEAMSFAPVRFMTEKILEEGIQVAAAAGFAMEEGFFDKAVTYLATAGPHKPSMMIDIETGAATEVDFIMQKIIDYGEKHNVPTPFTRSVTSFVRGLEQANRIAKAQEQ